MMRKALIILNVICLAIMLSLSIACADSAVSIREDVTFERTWISVELGEEVENPAKTAIEGEVAYESSNQDIVTVDENGKITGEALGTAEITATIEDYSAKCYVSVVEKIISSNTENLSLTFKTDMDILVGDTVKVETELKDANGNIIDRPITWSSKDDSIALINEDGSLMGISSGVAKIVARVSDARFTINVIVRQPVSTLEQFVALQNATESEYFALTDDITITASGIGVPEQQGDLAYTISGRGVDYFVFASFYPNLDGRGHTIKYVNSLPVLDGDNTGCRGPFLFNSIQGNIENVNFDMTVTDSTLFHNVYCGILCHDLTGTIQNSFFKARVANATKLYPVIRNVEEGGVLRNNIYDIDKNSIGFISRRVAKEVSIEGYIAITNGKVTKTLFSAGGSTVKQVVEENSVVYSSMGHLFNTENFGKQWVVPSTITDADGFFENGEYQNRTTKMDYGNDGVWEFDYANGEVRLCGKVVLLGGPDAGNSVVEISTPAQLLEIRNAIEGDTYKLMNDITLNVYGGTSIPAGDTTHNAAFVFKPSGSVSAYSVLGNFEATLDGNGYKIIIINDEQLKDLKDDGVTYKTNERFGGVFGEVTGTIKNVNFDVTFADNLGSASPYLFKNGNRYGTLAFSLVGEISDCFVKVKTLNRSTVIGSNTNASSIIRETVAGAKVNNVICDMTESKCLALVGRVGNGSLITNQIIITDLTTTLFGGGGNVSGSRQFLVPTSAKYANLTELFDVTESGYGKVLEATNQSTSANYEYMHKNGSYVDRDSKLEFTGESWTFDYTNGVVKLCGKTVLTNA